MKTRLLLIIFFALPVISFAQLDVNEPYGRNEEFAQYSDTSAHSNFLPSYFILKDTLKQFSISPVFYISPKFDLSAKKLYYNSFAGVQFDAFYKKFRVKNVLYAGIMSNNSVTGQITDSLYAIPTNGKILHLYSINAIFGNIIGDISYQPEDFITFQIGNNKTFLGDGYRSLILSDYSNPYPYFKATVRVWKVQYLWMISHQQGYDNRYSKNPVDFSPKNTFTHYLSFNFLKRFNFSMFETVVTSPIDSLGAHRGLDFNYLNPVIFYRPVEMSIGSPDNVLVGFTGHIKLFKSTMLYGQIFIDEFILSHIKSSVEYWDEKYGIQTGYKCYNTFGIKKFYTQVEFNAVRPYTYSHNNPIDAYTNANLPLAHPLGANFVEILAIASYQYKNYYAQMKMTYAKYGDNDSLNYGHNPVLSYDTRIGDEGIEWLQGVPASLSSLQFSFGMKKNRVIWELDFIYRNLSKTAIENNFILATKIGIPLFNEYYDF